MESNQSLLQLKHTVLGTVVLLALLGVTAGTAGAVSFTLSVEQAGSYQGTANETMLGCVPAGSGMSNCGGGGAAFGDLTIDSWAMFVDEDPVVSGIIALTNNSLVTQTYKLLFTLLVAPPVVPSSLIGGSIQGGVTDNNGNGATLATTGGNPFYTAKIDGAGVATLYPDPSSVVVVAPFGSGNLLSLDFGAPIPSLPGPAALASIAIELEFSLTAGDSASFTSNFVVVPIPEPGTAALLSLGLVALGSARRSRRS